MRHMQVLCAGRCQAHPGYFFATRSTKHGCLLSCMLVKLAACMHMCRSAQQILGSTEQLAAYAYDQHMHCSAACYISSGIYLVLG